jgi:hypothetical protein
MSKNIRSVCSFTLWDFEMYQLIAGPASTAFPSKPPPVDHTAEVLAARVLEQEHRIYPQAIRWFAEGRLAVQGGRVNDAGATQSQSVFASET